MESSITFEMNDVSAKLDLREPHHFCLIEADEEAAVEASYVDLDNGRNVTLAARMSNEAFRQRMRKLGYLRWPINAGIPIDSIDLMNWLGAQSPLLQHLNTRCLDDRTFIDAFIDDQTRAKFLSELSDFLRGKEDTLQWVRHEVMLRHIAAAKAL